MLGKRTEWLLLGDGGATSIEYAIIAGFISIVIVGTVTMIGLTVAGYFQGLAAAF